MVIQELLRISSMDELRGLSRGNLVMGMISPFSDELVSGWDPYIYCVSKNDGDKISYVRPYLKDGCYPFPSDKMIIQVTASISNTNPLDYALVFKNIYEEVFMDSRNNEFVPLARLLSENFLLFKEGMLK